MPISSADKLEIQELITRYNHATDSGDAAAFAATFTEDGSFTMGENDPIQGRENLTKMASGGGGGGSRHWTANYVIEGEGNSATLRCYVMVTRTQEGTKIGMTGLYTDELKKVDGAWLFSKRRVAMDG